MGACESVNEVQNRNERVKIGKTRALTLIYTLYVMIIIAAGLCWFGSIISIILCYISIILAITGTIMAHLSLVKNMNVEEMKFLPTKAYGKDFFQNSRNVLISSGSIGFLASLWLLITAIVSGGFLIGIFGAIFAFIQSILSVILSVHIGEIRSALLNEAPGLDCCGPPTCNNTLCCANCKPCYCGADNTCSGKPMKNVDIEAGEVTNPQSSSLPPNDKVLEAEVVNETSIDRKIEESTSKSVVTDEKKNKNNNNNNNNMEQVTTKETLESNEGSTGAAHPSTLETKKPEQKKVIGFDDDDEEDLHADEIKAKKSVTAMATV